MGKQVTQLTLHDFAIHPIWSFEDDDGDDVVPVAMSPYLSWPPSGGVLFVACEFVLSDNTKVMGYVGVRMPDYLVYLLGFPEEDGSFFLLPINTALEGSASREELAAHIRKPTDAIFPVTYSTPYTFKDGHRLAGRYDLPK